MILRRINPKANPNNALQFTSPDAICCGDSSRIVVCKYGVTIDITSVTTVNTIRIAGKTYTLDGTYALAQKRERDALIENIKEVVRNLGFQAEEIAYTLSGNNLTISTPLSNLHFEWLQTSANPFLATLCQVYGENDGKCNEARAEITKVVEALHVFPVSCGTITNVKVNDGSGNIYDGDLTNGAAGVYTVSVVSGRKRIAFVKDWDGSTTFTVTITLSTGLVYVQTAVYTFTTE
jgi:hypothetical protein